jgi:hypothetical protein
MKFFLYFLFFALKILGFSYEIAVITLAVGEAYQKQVEPGLINKQRYCQLHNYKFVLGKKCLDLSRPIPWSKIKLILEVMKDPNIKWIFWTDADSLIMNQNLPLEELIDENFCFIVTNDLNASINSGQFFLKNCEWSRNFLKDVYSHKELIHHGWWENKAIIDEFEQKIEVREHTKILKQRVMNSYPPELTKNLAESTYQKGDFIIHFPSIKGERLKKLMKYYYNK